MATGAGRQTGPVHLPSLDVDVCPVTGSVEFLRLHASYLPKMEKSISRKEQVLGIVQGGCAGSSRKKGKVASPHSKHVDDEKLPESTVPKQRCHGHGRAQSGCHRRKGGSGRKRRTTNRDRNGTSWKLSAITGATRMKRSRNRHSEQSLRRRRCRS